MWLFGLRICFDFNTSSFTMNPCDSGATNERLHGPIWRRFGSKCSTMLDSLPAAGTKCSASAWHSDWCAVDSDDLKMGDAVIGGGEGGVNRPRFACDANDDESLAAEDRKNKKNKKLNRLHYRTQCDWCAFHWTALADCTKTIQGKQQIVWIGSILLNSKWYVRKLNASHCVLGILNVGNNNRRDSRLERSTFWHWNQIRLWMLPTRHHPIYFVQANGRKLIKMAAMNPFFANTMARIVSANKCRHKFIIRVHLRSRPKLVFTGNVNAIFYFPYSNRLLSVSIESKSSSYAVAHDGGNNNVAEWQHVRFLKSHKKSIWLMNVSPFAIFTCSSIIRSRSLPCSSKQTQISIVFYLVISSAILCFAMLLLVLWLWYEPRRFSPFSLIRIIDWDQK